MLLQCRSILYGEIPREEEDVLDADRDLLTSRSVHTALLSSIPFTSAAIGMVVRYYSNRHRPFPILATQLEPPVPYLKSRRLRSTLVRVSRRLRTRRNGPGNGTGTSRFR